MKPRSSALLSNVIHGIGALVGFGSMVAWILICFTKSDAPKCQQTEGKKIRNKIYHFMGYSVTVCLVVFLLAIAGQLQSGFPLVFWLEAVILTGSGVCCLVKSRILI